jgi:hypothetical protein
MKLKSVLTMLAVVCFVAANAQTADEIINKYFENTGGKAKWEALQGLKTTAKLKGSNNGIAHGDGTIEGWSKPLRFYGSRNEVQSKCF